MSLSKYIFKQFQLQKQIIKETVKEMKDFNRLLKSLVFQKLVSTTFQRGFEFFFFHSNILQNPKGNLHSCKNLQYTWLKKNTYMQLCLFWEIFIKGST